MLYLVDLEMRRARRLEITVLLLASLGNKAGAKKGYFEYIDAVFPENVKERTKFEVTKKKVLDQEIQKVYQVVSMVKKQSGWDRLREHKVNTGPVQPRKMKI